MITLETERLFMREFILPDAKYFFELNNDPEVVKYTGDKNFARMEDAETLVVNYDQYEKYKSGRLSVLLKSSGELLGWCGLKYHPEDGETDLGYRFFRKYWGMGYATEASLASIKYGFGTLKLERIIARAMKENMASIRVMEKCGMKYWKDTFIEGQDSVCYVIDNHEFQEDVSGLTHSKQQ